MFNRLPRELRDFIWARAAYAQCQEVSVYVVAWLLLLAWKHRLILATYIIHTAEGQTTHKSPASSFPERLRVAFNDHDGVQKHTCYPLKVGAYSSTDSKELHFSTNEAQMLVSNLPIALVCSEARSQAIKFCQDQIRFTHLIYPDVSRRSKSAGDEAPKPLFVHPRKIMISNGQHIDELKQPMEGFNSAEHLVDVVNRVFGSCAEHVILASWVHGTRSLEEIYWPHDSRITKKWKRREIKTIFEGDQGSTKPVVLMKPDWTIYRTDEHMDRRGFDLRYVAEHLTKFREILDASQQKLPRLRSIELNLYSSCWGEDKYTRVLANVVDGVLVVEWADVKIGFHHQFLGIHDRVPEESNNDEGNDYYDGDEMEKEHMNIEDQQ